MPRTFSNAYTRIAYRPDEVSRSSYEMQRELLNFYAEKLRSHGINTSNRWLYTHYLFDDEPEIERLSSGMKIVFLGEDSE